VVQAVYPLTGHAPVRVAFTLIPRRRWAGGYNYQRNLFAALHRYRPGQLAPVVFAGALDKSDDLLELSSIPGVEAVQSRAFDPQTSGLALSLTLGIDRAAVSEFKKKNIDVVVETARFFGWRLPYPAVAWIPDFQHRRLPQLFSPVARWRREIGFRVQIASGRTIMLSSESALKDCKTFYPAVASRASVVRFASLPSADLLAADPIEIVRQYSLPERFFFLPNQFWRHKNHQVVLDALAIVKSRGEDVIIAASGSKDDPREPDYFENIMKQIVERDLSRNFRYLGMIPLSQVYALLRVSVALINPSRFEGWSTTVEEAKSFGVPMILSDLDVHREQTAGMASYFGPDDPGKLADHLIRIDRDGEPYSVRGLVHGLDTRVSLFAADFVRTILSARRSGGTYQA
jgi:glycosyltransferase involved in cell wall biosynthesis